MIKEEQITEDMKESPLVTLFLGVQPARPQSTCEWILQGTFQITLNTQGSTTYVTIAISLLSILPAIDEDGLWWTGGGKDSSTTSTAVHSLQTVQQFVI